MAAVEDLRIHFRTKGGVVHAVDGVTFDIRDGETLGLVGETGCGKSVTARAFLRLVPVPPGIYRHGRIRFWSRKAGDAGAEPVDLLEVPQRDLLAIRGNRIAMIFQDPGKALNPALPVGDQVGEVFYHHRSAELLEGLGGARARRPPSAGPPPSERGVSSAGCSRFLRCGGRPVGCGAASMTW
ncbi:MAG: ATP-binding cassette domain-containing protein [Acidimicrobiales bacterium]